MWTFRILDNEPTLALFNGELVAVIASLGYAYDEFDGDCYEKTDWFMFNDCMGTINMHMLKKAYTQFLEENWSKVA